MNNLRDIAPCPRNSLCRDCLCKMYLLWNSILFYNMTIGESQHVVFPFLFVKARNFSTIEAGHLIFPALEAFELISIMFLLSTVWLIARAVRTSHTFHYNLRTLMYWYSVQSYSSFGARLVLLLYQTGIVDVSGNYLIDVPLMICGFLRFYAVQQTLLLLPFVFIERLLATILRKNYEQTPHSAISSGLLCLQCIVSVVVSAGIMFVLYDNYSLSTAIYFSACFVVTTVSALLILNLYFWNIRLLRLFTQVKVADKTSGRSDHFDHLAIRFQLKENIRAFKLILTQIVSSAVMICVCAFLAVLGMFILTDDVYWSQVTMEVFEISVDWFYIVTYTSALSTIPAWRKAIRNDLSLLFGVKTQPIIIIIELSSPEEQRRTYFAMYNQAWK